MVITVSKITSEKEIPRSASYGFNLTFDSNKFKRKLNEKINGILKDCRSLEIKFLRSV